VVIETCGYTTILSPLLRADRTWSYLRQGLHRGGSACPSACPIPFHLKGIRLLLRPKKEKKGKEKKIKSNTVLFFYSSSVSLADLRFLQGKESLFLCTVVGLDESFQIFCWMGAPDCLGNYLCEKIS